MQWRQSFVEYWLIGMIVICALCIFWGAVPMNYAQWIAFKMWVKQPPSNGSIIWIVWVIVLFLRK